MPRKKKAAAPDKYARIPKLKITRFSEAYVRLFLDKIHVEGMTVPDAATMFGIPRTYAGTIALGLYMRVPGYEYRAVAPQPEYESAKPTMPYDEDIARQLWATGMWSRWGLAEYFSGVTPDEIGDAILRWSGMPVPVAAYPEPMLPREKLVYDAVHTLALALEVVTREAVMDETAHAIAPPPEENKRDRRRCAVKGIVKQLAEKGYWRITESGEIIDIKPE